MKTIKIMPCLDIKDGRVVKGVHFVDIPEPMPKVALWPVALWPVALTKRSPSV
jgi:hypothetical protein